MKVYLDTVGCRLNQSEIESYACQFRAAGHSLVASAEQADLVVLNTCAVTAAAESDSRQKIRQAGRAGAKEIVLTGCWASLNPEAATSLPGVSRLIPNLAKDRLVVELLHLPEEAFEREPIARQPLPGARARTRAFLKVQDGCDNRCTFCITAIARGPARSRPIVEVLADVRAALAGGTREIVLSGVHLGAWGQDFSSPLRLRNLVGAILAETNVPRLRLSSLEPWDLDAEFFALWEDTRLCRHLHLPLQSGCAATLRRMARKTTPEKYAALLGAVRQVIPEVAITTDLIVGFPGESEAEFAASFDFVGAMNFAGGHAFSYSARPGTAAARMPEQIPHPVRKERNAQMRSAIAQSASAYRSRYLGQTLPVLWESVVNMTPQGWQLSGLTDNYLRVKAHAERPLWNEITAVHLAAITDDGFDGTIIGENHDHE
jgi:threonylcarbamoyladenosine tRNA methylthiotransferase MtaB